MTDALIGAPSIPKPWLTVVGIGDDGFAGLGPRAKAAISDAKVIAGAARQLALVPVNGARAVLWDDGLVPKLDALIEERVVGTVILASGDPLLYGVGSTVASRLHREDYCILPAVSSFALASAAMGWAQTDVTLVSACGRPLAALAAELFDGARIILLSADRTTPAKVAQLLIEHKNGRSRITLLEHIGGPSERKRSFEPKSFIEPNDIADLNCLAISVVADEPGAGLTRLAGLPDHAYENDGQITRREVRAVTLAALSPRPGELLWDIGTGSGSVGIEWLRGAPRTKAIGIEPKPERATRARVNTQRLGVPGFQIIEGRAPEALSGLPVPDAIFIGGGLGGDAAEGAKLIATLLGRLKPGGRLVANAVTLETEAILLAAFARHGGTLIRIAVERADPVGRLTGWRPAMTVMQWAFTKPYGAEPK